MCKYVDEWVCLVPGSLGVGERLTTEDWTDVDQRSPCPAQCPLLTGRPDLPSSSVRFWIAASRMLVSGNMTVTGVPGRRGVV